MKKIIFLPLLLFSIWGYGQYCIPYYETAGCSGGDMIDDFTIPSASFSHLGTGCPGTTGVDAYSDFTAMTIALQAGGDYDFTITHGYGTQQVRIWIDFDGNQAFDNPSELVASATSVGTGSGATHTAGTISIPLGANVGTTRMRVVTRFSTIPGSCDQIASSSWGEVHDYTVNILPPPACLPPSNLEATNITDTSANIGWTENGTATIWDIEWGTENFAPTGTPNITGTTNNPYTLGGLTQITKYDFYVRADCGGGSESTWTGPYTFQTGADCTGYTLSVTATGGNVCDEGSATLSATASGGGNDIFWYDAAVNGNMVGIGATFETPFLTMTTSYWAAEVVTSGSPLTGQGTATYSGSLSTTTNGGIIMNVTDTFLLIDAEVYSTSAAGGSMLVEVRDIDNGNATVGTVTVNMPAGGTTTAPIPVTIPLNIILTPGNYRLVKVSGPTFIYQAGTWPQPLGSSGNVTGGSTLTGTSTLQYIFYNLTIMEGEVLCESTRDEAVATVHQIIDVTASATQTSINPGGSTTLNASSTNTNYTYVWNPGNLSGASVSVSPSQHTTYTVIATDTLTGCEATDEITILVFNTLLCNDLDITSVSGSYICDEGTATLSVTAAGISGDEIYWYDAAVGGNRVGIGATFDTPFLTQTTSYWATEVMEEGGTITGVGIVTPSGTGTNSTVNYGMEFTVTEPVTIVSVDVLSTANGGDLSIALYDANNLVVGNHIAYHTETIVAGNYHTILLNFQVPAAGTYRLVRAAQSVTIALRSQNTTGVTNPYPIGTIGQINGGHSSLSGTITNSQYMFYNWTVSTAFSLCESPREEVIATVVETVNIDVSATQTSINPGGNTTLTATSTNTNYTYVWNPGNLSGASVNVSPSQHTTYTVTATDSVTGCETTDEIEILVFNTSLCNQLDITTVTGGYVCDEGTTTLSATAAGISGNEIYWYDAMVDGNRIGIGSTFEIPHINQTTSFWAAEVLLGTKVLSGQAFANPTTFTNSTSNAGGLLFYVDSPITIIDVEVFSTNANSGDITIELRDVDNGNAIIATTTASITGGGTAGAPIPQTIPINFSVPTAGNYRLVRSAATATVGMGYVTAANSNFPYPLGSSGAVTGGSTLTGTSTLQYFFFNWTIEEPLFLCESPREEVIATVVDVVPVEATATATSIDPGNSTTLNASSTNTNYTYEWTWDGGGPLAGASVMVSPTAHTTYTVTATDSVTGCVATDEITILVFNTALCNSLDITTTIGDVICSGETATLSATASGTGSVIYWYDAEFDGNKVGEGATFETPTLTATTSYWAAEVLLGGGIVSGQGKPTYTAIQNTNGALWGLVFDAFDAFTIVDVEVYSTAALGGDIDVELQDNTGATLASATVNIAGGGSTTTPVPYTLPLNFNVPGPGTYRLIKTNSPVNMIRESTAANNIYPYPLGTVGEITSGYISGVSQTYYWFYNWTISDSIFFCESDREETIASIIVMDEVNVTATQMSISPGGSTSLTASSTNTNYSYVWTWSGGSDTGATISVSPTIHTTYTVTATDSVTGCATQSEITILVFNLNDCNDLDVISFVGDIICIGETATLSATGAGITGNEIHWYDSAMGGNFLGTGTTYETPALTQTTSYWAAEVISTIEGTLETTYASPSLTFLSGGGALTFTVNNTNPFTIKISDIAHYATANNTATWTLWYHPTDISGVASDVTAANGWIQAAPSQMATNPGGGEIIPVLSGINVFVPANTAYRFALQADNNLYYSGATTAPNEFTLNNVNLWVGDNVNSTGSSGGFPVVSTNSPRFFYGSVTFESLVLCESAREEVIATVTSDDAPVGDATQEFKAGSGDMLNDLDVNGSNLTWYSDAAGTTVVPGTTMLVGGTTYYVSQTINGCESQMLAITVVEVVCNAPTALNASGITQTTVQISWTASTSANGGYAWAVFNSGANPATATPVVDGNVAAGINTVLVGGLTANTTYDFYISSYCGTSIMSDMAGPLTFTTDPLPCNAPTALSMGTVTQTTAQFSWSASPNETGGYAWYVFASGANPNTATPVTSGNVGTGITTVNVSTLTASTTYDFYVAALCVGGAESPKAGPVSFTTAAMPCDAPTALAVGNVTQNSAQFTWTASATETGGYAWYKFAAGANPNTATPLANGNVATGVTTVNVSGMSPSTAYDFYVSTMCTGGVESSKAGPLSFTTGALVCDEPTALMAGTITETTAEISWTASASETNGYDWAVFNAGADPLTDTPVDNGSVATGVTSITITGLTQNTSYDVYVRTNCGTDGLSDWAGPLNFTTQPLGIRDNIIEGFTFYPNPMADVINISAKNTIDEVVIFNLIGQKLIDQKIGATTAQFDVSNFASGPYLMQVTSNGQIGIFRIIKK